jgi:hypothetical protein
MTQGRGKLRKISDTRVTVAQVAGVGGVEGMLKRLRRYASRRAGCVRLYAEGDARNNAQSKKHRENLLRAKRVRS